MKKRNFLLASILTLGVLAGSSVSAASDRILTGTPVIDGNVDEVYTQSLTLDAVTAKNAYDSAWGTTSGKIYFLYDSKNLYICADIQDADVTTRGVDYCKDENPYKNDCCEFRLSLDGGKTTIKVGVDAYGYRAYGLKANEEIVDYSTINYKTNVTSNGYVIETAIPCTEGVLDLITAGKLGFKLQLNDVNKNGDEYYFFATDYAGEGPKGLVYYDLSTEVATIKAPETVPSTTAETPKETATTSAPATADTMLVSTLILAASSAAIAVSKKKSKH